MKVAIIGVGAISRLHINAVLSAGGKIVSLCDISPEKCRQAQEKYHLQCSVYENYIEMLEKEELDVVHVCTPHYLHAEMTIHALKRNVNVLCEKPLAISRQELADIKAVVEKTDAKLAVCHQTRYNETNKFVKEYLTGKKIQSATGTLCWQRDAAYYSQGAWRGKMATEGGGVMINQALHTLDLLQWFCGMPISVISHTFNDTLKGVIDVEETAFGIFKTKEGCNFIVSATNSAKHSFPISIMIRTEEETIIILEDNIFINGKLYVKSDGLPVFGKEVWGTGHIKLIKDFYRCIETQTPFPIGYEEGKNVIELIMAMYESDGEEIFLEA